MSRLIVLAVISNLLAFALAAAAHAQTPEQCPIESVKVGNVCVDKYEASVWQIPADKTALIKKVRKGKAITKDLTAGGAVQLGCTGAPFNHVAYPASFPPNGNWTAPVYAAAVTKVVPSACITWFQAEQACRLSGKRLLTNQEWQAAASGTPDGPPCLTSAPAPAANIGAGCISNWGVENMVGNVWEWVGDWIDRPAGCSDWTSQTGIAGGDMSCFGGPGEFGTSDVFSIPSAPVRGGDWSSGTSGGVFAVDVGITPLKSTIGEAPPRGIGFRCAR